MSARAAGRARAPSLWLAAIALVVAGCGAQPSPTVTIDIRWSRFMPTEIIVPAGVPVTFVFENHDPIDHEWIVGDEELHAYHRTGTEPIHGERPTEVMLPALETRSTTVTFDQPGRLLFICHLPAHESYGMVGTLEVVP